MVAGRGVGSGCLTVGMCDFHVSVCVHARTECGRCASVQFAVVSFTHAAYYIASTEAILSIASIMTNNQNVLGIFGGVQ